ncbi:MAG: hypothetical protein AB2A00_31495 [Myxococcota bacterium]
MKDRTPCCLEPRSRCGTRWNELRTWVFKTTGKGIRIVDLQGDEQGRTPFFAQPVGYDGRSFFVARDQGCDTEKLLHEACHFFMAPKERRNAVNYGLGPVPGPFRDVDDFVSDNEEVATSLLEGKLAPYFKLPEHKLYRPDYNVANRRHLKWDECEERAEEVFQRLLPTLPR